MRQRYSVASRFGILLAAAIVGSCPRLVAAQIFELGGGVGRGCTGDSSGFCSNEHGAMGALYGGLWISPRVQVAVRIAVLPQDDFNYSTPRDDRFALVDDPALRSLSRIDIKTRERRRVLTGVEALYHFAGSSRAGAMLGVGLGTASDRMVVSCEPAGCDRILSALGSRVGGIEGHVGNLTLSAGLSGSAGRRVRISAGVRLHNFAGESWSTTEAFTSLGILVGAF